ncbi:MAG: septum site-determining protein MinD [Clostridia bacterium]|nr:septum site-determining protein MinD [Clostridia bacterium]
MNGGVEQMARKIVVTSGKGGVGKTTVAVNLSAQLARRGQRVILCDADFGLNNVDVAAGVEHLITYDIVDVIEGRCRAKQALVRHPTYGNLYLLTSSHSAPERYVSPQAVKVVLDALAPQFDFIFIDCPAGIDDGFHRAVATADEAIVVTTPHISALRDADKVITVLKSYQLNDLTAVVNMARGDLLLSRDSLSPTEISELLKIPLLGVLPEDYGIYQGEITQPHSAFRILANNLLTGKRKLYDVTRKYSGVFGNIRRVLKRNL